MLVLLADDAFVFMIAWELMSVSSYFLVAYQHQHAANRRAAFLYLLMAHIGGLAILLGFGVLASFGAGFTFEAMRAAELSPPGPRSRSRSRSFRLRHEGRHGAGTCLAAGGAPGGAVAISPRS